MAISRPDNSALSAVQVSKKALNCTICMDEEIAEEQKPKMVITACGHSFHEECMLTYFNKMPENEKNCPVCRQETVPFTRPSGIDEQANDEDNPYFESRFVKLIRRNSANSAAALIEELNLTPDDLSSEIAGASAMSNDILELEGDWDWVPQTIEEAVEASVAANAILEQEGDWDWVPKTIEEAVEASVAANAILEQEGAWGEAPLAKIKSAAEIKKEKQAILNKSHYDIRSDVNTSLVGLAASYNNKEIALRLIHAGAKFDEPDTKGNTPLMQAIQYKHTDLAMLLMGFGADINATNHKGASSTHFAASTGDWTLLENLLAYGADITAHSETGMSLLYTAAMHGHADVVEKLFMNGLENQINSTKSPNGITPLYAAVFKGYLEAAEKLLQLGADPEIGNSSNNVKPLHVAANKGNLAMCRMLLDQNANINARMKNGSTPLIEAAIYNHIEVVRLLIERGADKTLKVRFPMSYSIFPYTAADVAKEDGNMDIYRLLCPEQ